MARARDSVAEPLAVEPQAGPPDPEIDFDELDRAGAIQPVEEAPEKVEIIVQKDPTLDPANPRFNPARFFAQQPKEVIVLMLSDHEMRLDPEKRGRIVQPVSINGYQLDIVKGVPTQVPADFAEYLVWIGAAYRFNDAVMAQPAARQ